MQFIGIFSVFGRRGCCDAQRLSLAKVNSISVGRMTQMLAKLHEAISHRGLFVRICPKRVCVAGITQAEYHVIKVVGYATRRLKVRKCHMIVIRRLCGIVVVDRTIFVFHSMASENFNEKSFKNYATVMRCLHIMCG